MEQAELLLAPVSLSCWERKEAELRMLLVILDQNYGLKDQTDQEIKLKMKK